jgi:hypothetical protein
MFKRGHRNAAHICRLARAFPGTALAIGVLTGSSSAAVDAQRSAAVSQELPLFGALSPIEATSIQWAQTGSPTFRWKFPARDGSAQHLVTMTAGREQVDHTRPRAVLRSRRAARDAGGAEAAPADTERQLLHASVVARLSPLGGIT